MKKCGTLTSFKLVVKKCHISDILTTYGVALPLFRVNNQLFFIFQTAEDMKKRIEEIEEEIKEVNKYIEKIAEGIKLIEEIHEIFK